MAENRMNLAALQQRDPYITGIVDTASQVALYSFSSKTNEWEKTDVEGTLFVYTRSASPINGFMILNRLGLNDLIEPLTKNLEFQLQDPFLLYRNAQACIYGIWFYDKDECARIGQFMNSLVQVAMQTHEKKEGSGRQRRASESDTLYTEKPSAAMSKAKNVDILEMLSKAQDEYDKTKGGGGGPVKKSEPKPMIDNPNASATKATGSSIIKPLALKMQSNQDQEDETCGAVGGATCGSTTPNTQISLETLFQRASMQNPPAAQSEAPPAPNKLVNRSQSMMETSTTNTVTSQPQIPDFLQRLLSNQQGGTLEEIERHQHREMHRDEMPKPAGEETPPSVPLTNHVPVVRQSPLMEPDSPNTALKRTLNILPASPKVGGVGAIPKTHAASNVGLSSSAGAALFHRTQSDQSFKTDQQQVESLNMSESEVASKLLGGASNTSPQGERGLGGMKPLGCEGALGGAMLGGSQHMMGVGPGGDSHKLSLAPTASLPGQSGGIGEVLLTPQAFQSTSPTTQLLKGTPAASVLPLPTVFQPSGGGDGGKSKNAPGGSSADVGRVRHLTPGGSTADVGRITHLTQDQMQQAMLHLIKNDPEFMKTLHEAYVKSLHDMATQSRPL